MITAGKEHCGRCDLQCSLGCSAALPPHLSAWRAQPVTPLPVDHTVEDVEHDGGDPPTTTTPRWLYFGTAKLGWGLVCCFVLPPLRGVYTHAGAQPPAWAQAPCETLLRVAFRLLPPVWAISDHFIGAYCNMYYS